MIALMAFITYHEGNLPEDAVVFLGYQKSSELDTLDQTCNQLDIPCGFVDCDASQDLCKAFKGVDLPQYLILQNENFKLVPHSKPIIKYATMWFEDMFCDEECPKMRQMLRFHSIFHINGNQSVKQFFQRFINKYKLQAVFTYTESEKFSMNVDIDGRKIEFLNKLDKTMISQFIMQHTNSKLPNADGETLSRLLQNGTVTLVLIQNYSQYQEALDAIYSNSLENSFYVDCEKVPDYCNKFDSLMGYTIVLIHGKTQRYAILKGQYQDIAKEVSTGNIQWLSESELVRKISQH